MQRLTMAALALLALGTACGDSDDGTSVEITNLDDDATIEGNVVELDLDVSGIDIVSAADDPGDGDTGHFHVFIDRDPVDPGETIPAGEPDVIHTAENPIQVTGLSAGEHRIVVVLGDRDHVRIGDAIAQTSFEVEGPTLDVTGPATAEVGNVIQVEVTVEGVELVAPDEDDSDNDGSAGHLHLFVNKDPTPRGEPIPADDPAIIHTTSRSVAFPADLFTEGTNTIWVMLGYADHTPFEPLVLDRIVIEVGSAG